MKELLVAVFDSIEQLAIENVKMKLLIRKMHDEPLSESQLDRLIAETQLLGDAEATSRWYYAQAREAIQQRPDPEMALTTMLEQLPKRGRLQ